MTWRIRGRSFEGGGALGFQLYLRGSLTDGPSVDSFYSSFSIRVIDIVLFWCCTCLLEIDPSMRHVSPTATDYIIPERVGASW